MMKGHPETRIWANIKEENGCWLWTRSLDSRGYAQIRVNGVLTLAHRFIYKILIGEIPDGLVIDHLCRVKRCLNPYHMEPVTSAENTMRGDGVGSKNSRKTKCQNGHTYDMFETGRRCRRCRKESRRLNAKARRAKQKEARL